jgi:hypothetical protein
MSVDIAVPHQTRVDTSKRRFFHHYLEMIAVMLVAMLALGGVASVVFGLVGHSNLLHYAGLRAFVIDGQHDHRDDHLDALPGPWLGEYGRDGRGDGPSDRPSHRPVLGGGAVGWGTARSDARVDASIHVRRHASPLQRVRTGPPEPFKRTHGNA